MTEFFKQYVFEVLGVEKVHDGDTFWLHLDMGFRQSLLIDIRLNGYDCPELNATSPVERTAATQARVFTDAFLSRGATAGTLWVQTYKDPDSFGRWMGDLYIVNNDQIENLGTELAEQKLASVWPTRWHEQYLVASPAASL